MSGIRLYVALLLTLIFLPGIVLAQYGPNDSGQFVIQSAQYGTARRHIDVTQRLKQIASRDRTFRMGNSTFGTDPDPGQVKTLRIYARVQMATTACLSIVKAAQSMAPCSEAGVAAIGAAADGTADGTERPGRPGNGPGDSGQFVIQSAQYGTARRHIDVTNRLKELARQDRTFRMGNSTFGTDPDPGRVKTLRIYARGPQGRERMFEYREGSVVDGSQFRGWGSGDWGNEPWNGRWGRN